MLLKQRINNFFLDAITSCVAILLIVFLSYTGTASVGLSHGQQSGFTSLNNFTDDVTLSNSPVTIPSPAVISKKGFSSGGSLTSKGFPLAPQTLPVAHATFSIIRKTVLSIQPLRLHLALRVLRI